jgi:assimilatory nitrate reductase catalytic subunit
LTPAAGADRLVKTHCCFCGQQCGIQLKVKDNAGDRVRAAGYEFPFNKGMLCPKGVRRYLQGLTPIACLGATTRFGARRVPRCRLRRRHRSRQPEIQRIQEYGRDAFAVLGGASMTTEKAT